MAIVNIDDLVSRISSVVGQDDDSLSLLEDVRDTFDQYKDNENWKAKYDELDASWRTKYKERFTNGTKDKEEEEEKEEEEKEIKTFDDLFTV